MSGGLGWRRWVEDFLRPKEQFGEPGRRLSSWEQDHEDAGAELASRFDQKHGTAMQAALRPGAQSTREAAQHALSRDLYDTWQDGEPYSSWVAKAARNAGI